MPDSAPPAPIPAILLANRTLDAYRLSWLANYYSGPIYARIEAELGLIRPEVVVLLCVAHVPGMTAMDVCRATGRPKNSISRAVMALAKRKAIVRAPDPADQRAMRLDLTREGRWLFARFMPLFEARETTMFAPLTGAERATFAALLKKLTLRTDGWAEPY